VLLLLPVAFLRGKVMLGYFWLLVYVATLSTAVGLYSTFLAEVSSSGTLVTPAIQVAVQAAVQQQVQMIVEASVAGRMARPPKHAIVDECCRGCSSICSFGRESAQSQFRVLAILVFIGPKREERTKSSRGKQAHDM
jgi:hypothetical protein